METKEYKKDKKFWDFSYKSLLLLMPILGVLLVLDYFTPPAPPKFVQDEIRKAELLRELRGAGMD